MPEYRWPDPLHPGSYVNFPSLYRLIVSSIISAALAYPPRISFPCNRLRYAAPANLACLQSTALTAIYDLSLLMMMFNSLLAWSDAARNVNILKRLTIIAASVAVILIGTLIGPRF